MQDPALRAGDPLAATNILKERRYGWGDVNAAKADVFVENSYSFPMVTHFAIEPHGFMASAEKDALKIWSPVQHPFLLQRIMADLFDLPLTQVRVFAPDPGGGFGGKQNPKLEPLVTFFASHRPPLPAGAQPRGDIPSRSAHCRGHTRTHRLHPIRRITVSGHQIRLSDRRLRRYRGTGHDQSELSGLWPLPDTQRQNPRPGGAVAHHAELRLPRLRRASDRLGRRVADGRGGSRTRLGRLEHPDAQSCRERR